MEEKKLTYKYAPWGYPLCFNNECSLHDRCMHYQVGLLAPADKLSGATVYPSAWKDGECKCFREKKIIQMAWGFSHLYDHLSRHRTSEARSHLRGYLGTGASAYYRYHHGELVGKDAVRPADDEVARVPGKVLNDGAVMPVVHADRAIGAAELPRGPAPGELPRKPLLRAQMRAAAAAVELRFARMRRGGRGEPFGPAAPAGIDEAARLERVKGLLIERRPL